MPILGNCKKLLKSTEITQKLSIKICFWEDDILILWLKGNKAAATSCSRAFHDTYIECLLPFITYSPIRAVAIARLEKVLLSLSSNAKFASLKFIMINLILYKS